MSARQKFAIYGDKCSGNKAQLATSKLGKCLTKAPTLTASSPGSTTASGTTITPERSKVADFCPPYAVSGQSLVADVSRHPNVHGIGDLKGLVIGVQEGNTSQPVADKLVAEHRAARVRVYAYDEIEKALDDLSTGGCDAFMKLAPVTAWFVRDRPKLRVVQTGITVERLGIGVRKGNSALHDRISKAQAALAADGTLAALIKQWLGAGATPPA
jgi:polar amino acid transport system substrate-binding protein